MNKTNINDNQNNANASQPMWHTVIIWLLLLPLIYYSVNGTFTFDSGLVRTQSGDIESSLTTMRSNTDRIQRLVIASIFFPPIFYFALVRNPKSIAQMIVKKPAIALVPVFALLSVAWTGSPLNTIYYGFNLVLLTLFSFVLIRLFDTNALMRFLMLGGFVFMALNALVAIAFPRYGTTYAETGAIPALQGICIHKNACAYNTVFFLSPVLFANFSGKNMQVKRFVYLSLGIVEVALTQSRTGWLLAASLFMFYFYYYATKKLSTKSIIFMYGVASLAFFLIFAELFKYTGNLFIFLGKDPTLTGRTQIWSAVMTSIMKHPILGYGYHGFWTGLIGESANIASAVSWNPGFAHSGYLELWVEVGAVGAFLVVWTFFVACKDAVLIFSVSRVPYLGFSLSVFILTVIVNIDEATLLGASNLGWLFYLLACLGLSSVAKSQKK